MLPVADNAGNMHLVFPGLFLGNAFAACNEAYLRSNGVTHILSIIRDDSSPRHRELIRMNVPVDDYPDEDLLVHFAKTNEFISQALKNGGVLVHCLQGYTGLNSNKIMNPIMATCSHTVQEAIAFLKEKRSIVNPNPGFVRQLEIYGLAHCDMSSSEGETFYQAWKEERDVAYAAKVTQLEQVWFLT